MCSKCVRSLFEVCSQDVRSVFAGCSKCVRHPKTISMSSVSNSGLITLAHVVSLIVNQSCHFFADGLPRDPVGVDILASLTRDTSGSRLPANTFLRISVDGSSGSAAPSPSSSGTSLQIHSVSHWTLWNIMFHGTRFSAQRQLMSYLTSVLIVLVVRTWCVFCSAVCSQFVSILFVVCSWFVRSLFVKCLCRRCCVFCSLFVDYSWMVCSLFLCVFEICSYMDVVVRS